MMPRIMRSMVSLPRVMMMESISKLGIFVSPFKYFPKADKQPSVHNDGKIFLILHLL